MASITLKDANNQLWQLEIVVTGGTPAWQSTAIPSGIAQTIVLIGSFDNNYLLTVDTSGNIGTVPSEDPGINFYTLGSSDCSSGWRVLASQSGAVVLTQIVPWDPGPVVGQLFPTDDTAGHYTQPGGIGTVVFPQQPIGERIGMWTAQCGHWFGDWLVTSCSVCGVQSALVQCPLCGIVQQIFTPYSRIFDDANYIIIG